MEQDRMGESIGFVDSEAEIARRYIFFSGDFSQASLSGFLLSGKSRETRKKKNACPAPIFIASVPAGGLRVPGSQGGRSGPRVATATVRQSGHPRRRVWFLFLFLRCSFGLHVLAFCLLLCCFFPLRHRWNVFRNRAPAISAKEFCHQGHAQQTHTRRRSRERRRRRMGAGNVSK